MRERERERWKERESMRERSKRKKDKNRFHSFYHANHALSSCILFHGFMISIQPAYYSSSRLNKYRNNKTVIIRGKNKTQNTNYKGK